MYFRVSTCLFCGCLLLLVTACSSSPDSTEPQPEKTDAKSENRWPGLRVNAYLKSILEEPLPPLDADQPELKTAEEYFKRADKGGTLNKDSYRRGMADFRRALDLDPNNADYWYAFAKFHNPTTWSGEEMRNLYATLPTKAGNIAEGAAELDPTDYMRWYRASELYTTWKLAEEKRDHASALRCLNKCVEAAPDNASPYFWRGCFRANGAPKDVLRDSNGKPIPRKTLERDALDDFEKSISLCKDGPNSNVLAWAGTMAQELGLWEKAVEHRTRALTVNPSSSHEHSLAIVYRDWAIAELGVFITEADGTRHQLPQKERLEKALAHFERAMELDKEKKRSDYDYAWAQILRYLHRFQEAEPLLNRARGGFKLGRAQCLFHMGNQEEAVAVIDASKPLAYSGQDDNRLEILLRATCKAELAKLLAHSDAEAGKLFDEALADLGEIRKREQAKAFVPRAKELALYAAFCRRGALALHKELDYEIDLTFISEKQPGVLLSSIVYLNDFVDSFVKANKAEMLKALAAQQKLLDNNKFGWTMEPQWEVGIAWYIKSRMLSLFIQTDSSAATEQEVVACLDKALEYRPAYPAALAQRAFSYYRLRKFAEGEADCTAAISLQPRFKEAFDYRLYFQIAQGKWKETAADAEKLIKFDPGNEYYRVTLGFALIELGELERAQQQLDAVIAHNPKNDQALATRAGLHIRRSNWAAAREDLDAAIAVNSKRADYYALHAQCSDALGEYDKALQALEQALKLSPEEPRYVRQRALAYAGKGEFARAIEDASSLIDSQYVKTSDFTFRAMCRYRHSKKTRDRKVMEAALEDCQKAVAAGEKNLGAHYAGILYFLGKRAEAASAGENSADLKDRRIVIETLLEDGKTDEALAFYNGQVEKDSKNVHALIGRARVYLALKRWQDALDDLNIAHSLNDKIAEIYIFRAKALLGLGKPSRARENLESALKRAKEQEYGEITTREYALAQIYALRSAAHGDEADKEDKSREDLVLAVYNLKAAVEDPFFPWAAAKVDSALQTIFAEKSVQEIFKGH